MNKIILLLGDLACGKSTYSQMLGDRYHCLVLNKDTIKEKLADTIGFANREENLKLSQGTFAVMLYVFEMIAKTGHDIILEANFHGDEMIRLYESIAKHNYQVLSAVFEADLDILFDRFIKRSKQNRHPAHLSQNLFDIESFSQYVIKSRDFKVKKPFIKIDANTFDYQNEDGFETFDNFMK